MSTLPNLEPSLISSSLCPQRLCGSLLPEIPHTSAALKAVEDQLDSLICAYVGAQGVVLGLKA